VAALLTFYVQTWDEYHTHTLTLGIVSGPVEGILTLCFVYAFTAYIGGGSFWQRSLLRTVGIPKLAFIPDILYELAWNEWYMVYGGVILVFNTIQRYFHRLVPDMRHGFSDYQNSSTLNVFHARRSRGQRTRIALRGLVPFFVAWILIPAYLYFQPIVLYHHLVPFVFFVGLINAYSVGQIIVAHLTKSRFPFYNVLVLPLLCAVVDSIGPYLLRSTKVLGWPSALGNDVYQVAFVFCCLGLAIGVYGSFVIDVVYTICDYLDIWCLTIKHPYRPARENFANRSAKDSKVRKRQ